MNYDSSDFAGGVPMNEPDAVRCCAPAASAYSDGIPAGILIIRVFQQEAITGHIRLWNIESLR